MKRGLVLLPNLLSQMNTFIVYSQMVTATKALPTFFTLMGFLSRVYLFVLSEVIVAYERLPAFITLVALIIMVDTEVESV